MFQKLTRRKRKLKKGQAMIETVCVLALHFFLISFMITGFQLMHNKMVYSMAAYEGVRTAIAYNPKSGYNIKAAKARAEEMVKNQIGSNKVTVQINNKGDFFECVVKADVKFLAPIIDPNLKEGLKKNLPVTARFTMRKERP